MSAARAHEYGVEALASRHIQAISLGAAEADIGADFRQPDEADLLPLRRDYVHAVIIGAANGTRPDIAVHIGPDPVSRPVDAIELHVREHFSTADLIVGQVEHLDVARRPGVSDVQLLVIGREADTV